MRERVQVPEPALERVQVPELERVRETYLHISGERGARRVRWMVGR